MTRSLALAILVACTGLGMGPASAQFLTPQEPGPLHKKCLPSVVFLICRSSDNDPSPSIGTGFLVRNADGKAIIITNNHVVDKALAVDVQFSDGRTRTGRLIERKPELDLATLSIAERPGDKFATLRMPSMPESLPEVGTRVIMIGNPLALSGTLHQGSVSRITTIADLILANIPLFHPDADREQKLIQTDITSIQGFSGAPIIDLGGNVVGVESEGAVGGMSGINFSIPIHNIKLLRTQGDGVAFNGNKPALRNLSSNLQAFNLNPKVIVAAERPEAPAFVPAAIMKSLTWGFVPRDPNFIVNNLLGDPEKFLQIILPVHINELLNRHQVVHITNPFFRYSFLLPESFDFREEIYPASLASRTTLTNKDPDLAAPLNAITIHAMKVPEVAREQLIDRFGGMITFYRDQILKLNVQPLGAPDDQPGRELVALSQILSDPRPRIPGDPNMARFNIARYTQLYSQQAALERSQYVFFGIHGDTFVVIEFRFNNSNVLRDAAWEANYIERAFIASSFTFFDF